MTSDEDNYPVLFKNYLNSFSPLSDASFEKLMAISKLRTVDEKEYLLQIGQIAKKRYFVCKGTLISEYLTEMGNRHIKNFFTKGNLAGSTASSLQDTPSLFAIQALKKSVVFEFSHKDYKQLIHENEDLKDVYIAYLEKSWVIKNERYQMAFATQTAAERYHTFLNEYPDLEGKIALTYVASYLGITPTQLSRIRNGIKK